ncbi:MAG: hypothetical protein ACLRMX_03400 [Lachnospira eligens]
MSQQTSLDNSYSAVFEYKECGRKSQINAKKLNSKGESDVAKALRREYEDKCDGICILLFNCLLMSQFWLIQRSREIVVKKIYGMSDQE